MSSDIALLENIRWVHLIVILSECFTVYRCKQKQTKLFCLKFFFMMVPTKNARKSGKAISTPEDHTARKLSKNIGERIKRVRSLKEIIKNMSLTTLLNMKSLREKIMKEKH